MEISNLVACDRAFGRHINECPWESRLLGMREDFNNRPAKERVYRGENEDSAAFLKILAQATESGKIKLPVVGYFRDLGFEFASSGRPIEGYLPDLDQDTGDSRGERYKLEYVHYQLSYRILVAAHSRAEVHEVAVPLHYYLSRRKTMKTHYLFFRDNAESENGGRPLKFTLSMTILNHKETAFKDATGGPESAVRIHSAVAEYLLRAPVFFMDRVEAFPDVDFTPITAL